MGKVQRVKYLKVAEGKSLGIDRFPNFDASGSVVGMRRIYGEDALLVRCGSYIYNVSSQPDIYYSRAY